MGAGRSRSRSAGVGRSQSWAVQETSKSLYRSFGGSFKQLQCVVHGIGFLQGCRSENYLLQKGGGAIVGLHSNWIGDYMLACARPSDRIISEHHIIYQFHSQNIGAIINLQESGEHAGCGDVFYFNFPSKDSKYMDGKLTLEICQAIDSQIAEGVKVAVHCHSGIGRTGLVIACYFLFSGAYEDPMEAIQTIRQERPGTLNSKNQVQFVKRFETYLHTLRVQFVPPEEWRKSLIPGGGKSYPNLAEIMVRQNEILHGLEREVLRFVPKVVDWITRELIRRTDFDRQKREKIATIFMTVFTTDLSRSQDDEIVQRVKMRLNLGDWSGIEKLETSVLCHVLLEWLHQLQEPVVPDSILTTALGRGDIESAIEELSKCDKCSFATIQCLACWMFQMVPVKAKLIRRLYSALAHELLASTSLQTDQPLPHSPSPHELPASTSLQTDQPLPHSPSPEAPAQERNPDSSRRHTVSRLHSVYTKYKPSLLEVEFGLLLEGSARFWIKLAVARHEEIANIDQKAVSTPPGHSGGAPSPDPLPMKLRDRHHMASFSQPWFRDRSSLQYEQYNPANALQFQKEMERGSIGGSTLSSPLSSFEELKPVVSHEEKKPVPLDRRNISVVNEEVKNKEIHEKKMSPTASNQKIPIARDQKKKPTQEKKNTTTREERQKLVADKEKGNNPVPYEEKRKDKRVSK